MGLTLDYVDERNVQPFPSAAVKAAAGPRAGACRRQHSAVATPSKWWLEN